MRTFTTRSCDARHAGFTLIELLVVMVIVAVLATSVVLGFVGADREQNLRTEAERLAALIELARTEALSRNEEWGIAIDRDSYRFLVFDPDLNRWQISADATFRERTLTEATLTVKVEALSIPASEANKDQPAILILSSGEQTPFDIDFTPTWDSRLWRVHSDGLSRTATERMP